jgi:hypothetical protein
LTEKTSASACLALAERTLRAGWVEGRRQGKRFAYTPPSPGRYPWQWYWDSCFHAIVWRRFDRSRAEAELRSLLAAQRPDGFIGHTILWDRPLRLPRLLFYNVASARAFTTETIQPPLLAWAWRIAVGDPAGEQALVSHHRWLEHNRALDGDGLLWIVQPDESGLDSSPKFDSVWGWRTHARPGFPLLVHRNRRLGWEARRVLAARGPLVCELAVNVLWCLSRLAMGQSSITPAIVDRLWDERRGLFLDRVRGGGAERRVTVSTWSALAPLALPDLPEEIGHRLVREHLLAPGRYWTPVPPPSVSAEEPAYEPGRLGFGVRHYWRGPTWVNAAWLLWLGLVRLGYEAEAAEMARALASAVSREGLREFYDPRNGGGMGAKDFGWSTLICELVDPDSGAADSYL